MTADSQNGPMGLAASEPLQSGRRVAIWTWAYPIAVVLVLILCWGELPAYVWSTEYYQDDWEWLRHGSSLSSFVDRLLHPTGIVRPVFHFLYFLAFPLSGTDARLLAVVLAVVWCATAIASVHMLRRTGFVLPVAVLAVALTLPILPTTDAFFQVSYQGLTLSRLFLTLTCIAFLRGDPPTTLWGSLLFAGVFTHEQYIVTAPILLVLLWWRDGSETVIARFRQGGSLRSFCAAFFVVVAVRLILFWIEERGGTHAPSL